MPLTFDFGAENRPELFVGRPKTPVTLLSGFLGTGKTTLLKHLLENQEGVRIGVVVNDVAAVNIDSQLVKRYEKGLIEVTELQNGCVCCSSADDLFAAVQNVVMRSRYHAFEHIVVELSGVGEPEAVKRNWAIGLECTVPVALRTEVVRVVTMVDAGTFGRDWLDTRQAQDRNEEMLGDRHDDKNKARFENVGQLLAEQVEWADVIVVNKTDTASPDELQTTEEIVKALNGSAPMHHTTFGKVSPSLVLPPVPKGLKAAETGEGDGYRWAQTAEDITVRLPVEPSVKGRDVEFKVGRQTLKLGLKGRMKPRAEGKLAAELKNVDDALFEIEGSGAGRCVVATLEKRRPGMWSDLWLSSPSAEGGGVAADKATGSFEPPERCSPCDDGGLFTMPPSVSAGSRAQSRFGIHAFAFQRRRPFNAKRLEALLKAWPTPNKELFTLTELELPAAGEAATPHGDECSQASQVALKAVLRSKGFCWLDSEPLKRHVWAHAGRTLSVTAEDWWWAVLDKEQLKFKVTYPGVEAEYELAKKDKWDREVGDRRQELAFIGGPGMQELAVVPLLDACLLSDDEFEAFKEKTRQLRVPDDDFHVNGLLKNLGATEDQIKDINQKAETKREEERLQRKQDREDTDFLRSLGVGKDIEPGEESAELETDQQLQSFEAKAAHEAGEEIGRRKRHCAPPLVADVEIPMAVEQPNAAATAIPGVTPFDAGRLLVPETFEAID